MPMGIRTAVMSSLEAGKFVLNLRDKPIERMKWLGILCRYGVITPSRKRDGFSEDA